MAEQFYTILTSVGKAKIANAILTGTTIDFATLKVGDSNGTYYNPSESQTDLVNSRYSCAITNVSVDTDNANWINILTPIPADVGGFYIREAGIFDAAGNLLAIAKYPETYKPQSSDGSTKEVYIKLTLEVSNTSSVELKIDPTIILATKEEINILTNSITQVNSQLSDIVSEQTTQNAALLNNANEIAANATNIATNASKIASLASGSPKGVYSTLSALQTAYPTGNTNTYIVNGDIKEIDTLTVTGVPTANGNVTITLNGVAFSIALTTAMTTTDAVATAIRGTTFSGWTTGGSGSAVTFTKTTSETNTTPTFSAGATGTTATITVTTAGVADDYGWYYWNGSAWTRGNTFQGKVIPDESIDIAKLNAEMQNDILEYDEVENITTNTAKAWAILAGKVSLTDYLSADALSAIQVIPGETYYVSLTGVNTAIYDIILTPAIGDYFTARYINDANVHTRYKVTIPTGANYMLINTATGTTAKVEKRPYAGIASKSYVENAISAIDIPDFTNFIDFSKLKFACFGDSTVADEVTGIGTIINSFLGTTLIGNFAHGNAKMSDWYSGATNNTVITPTTATNANDNTNVLSNQVRRCIKNSTANTAQTSWADRLTMSGTSEGTALNTYTLSGSDWIGSGNTSDIPDVIFIRMGINDGTSDTLVADDTNTVFSQSYANLTRCGYASSLRWAIETLQCAYPKANIFVASPLQVSNADARLSYVNTKLKRDISEKVCDFCSVHFIDSFAESGFSAKVARGLGSYDGVHPWQPWRNYVAEFEANEIRKRFVRRIAA